MEKALLLYLPHHKSLTHPAMSRAERAVQFAPFAALSGFEGSIDRMAERVTEEQNRIETAPDDEAC